MYLVARKPYLWNDDDHRINLFFTSVFIIKVQQSLRWTI